MGGPIPGNQTFGPGITDDGGIAVTLPSGTIWTKWAYSGWNVLGCNQGTTIVECPARKRRHVHLSAEHYGEVLKLNQLWLLEAG